MNDNDAYSDNSLPLLQVEAQQWGLILRAAAQHKYRFVGIWAQDLRDYLQINVCLEFAGVHFLLRTILAINAPQIASVTPYYPAANRMERHIHDMFGIVFSDHPDQRRWTRHQAWTEKQFPLRKNFVATGVGATARTATTTAALSAAAAITPTAPDASYPFITAHGAGVYEIPVGPVHAGIIEPGHFRFQVAGEDVINLEEHLGYVHKGIEKIAEGRDIPSLIKLAGRISGDSTVAYAWATCRACEQAYAVTVSPRATLLRAIMCERERVANHLGDFAAICNDVGFAFAYYQLMRLKELWLRLNGEVFGHRLMMDCIVFGGVRAGIADINEAQRAALQQQLSEIKQELDELYPMIDDNSSLHDRLKNTGVLRKETAEQLGVLGYVGRASGSTFDLRRDAPYAPYDQLAATLRVPVYTAGDVLARTRIRAQEILVTLELLHELLELLGSLELSGSSELSKSSGALELPELSAQIPAENRDDKKETKAKKVIDELMREEVKEKNKKAELKDAIKKELEEKIKEKTREIIKEQAKEQTKKEIKGIKENLGLKEGLGLIEGWRGEILVYVSFNVEGLVERYFPRDPSWFSWLALEQLIHGNIVPDFPVCNKSINGSYSGVDL